MQETLIKIINEKLNMYQQNQKCNNSIFQDNQQAECIYEGQNGYKI